LKSIGTQRFKILLTIIPPKPSKDGEEAYTMLTEAGLPVSRTCIRRYAAFQKAALAGVPVYEVKDNKALTAWSDYQKAFKEMGL
jgi:chromosome partitioning protein